MQFLCIAGIFILNLDAKPNIPSTGYPRQTDYANCLGEKKHIFGTPYTIKDIYRKKGKTYIPVFQGWGRTSEGGALSDFLQVNDNKNSSKFFSFNICKVHSRQIFIEI